MLLVSKTRFLISSFYVSKWYWGQPPGPPLRDTVPQTPYEFMVCGKPDVGAYSSH
jgi:hypothetical protein